MLPSSKLLCVLPLLFAIPVAAPQTPLQAEPKPLFKFQEVMIPSRDGVRLRTVILTPVDRQEPLPILFRRTPYGVPDKFPAQMPPSMQELAQDGYTFVIQNLRRRFNSEGVFNLASWMDLRCLSARAAQALVLVIVSPSWTITTNSGPPNDAHGYW